MVAIVEEKIRSVPKDDDRILFNSLRYLFKSCQSCLQSRSVPASYRGDPVENCFNNQRVRKEYDSDDDGDIDGNDETIEFVWSDLHVIEEYVDGSLDRNYVHGNMFIDELILFEDSSGDYHYYLQDFRYTVYALVDDTGTIEERYRFDPYGKRTVVDDDGSIDEHYGF